MNSSFEPVYSQNIHKENARLLQYCQALIQKTSITPDDGGISDWIISRLEKYNVQCHRFTEQNVTNLIISIGSGRPSIALLGHSDVVPTGDESQWKYPPFSGQIHSGTLYGRGAADMKTGVACYLDAIEQLLLKPELLTGSIHLLITSDEEGEAEYGAKSIVNYLAQQKIALDLCLIAEPTANQFTGDTLKVGRRGSVSGKVSIKGKPGHVAYPHHIINPIHKMGEVISGLNQIDWDKGSLEFPGTSLQITHIDSGEYTDNVSPLYCDIHFNIRFSHHWCPLSLDTKIRNLLNSVLDSFSLEWSRACTPYLTDVFQSQYLTIIEQSIFDITGHYPALSTSGGTSDGRFISTLGCDVFELGVPNKTIHQINESATIKDIVQLRDILLTTMQALLNPNSSKT